MGDPTEGLTPDGLIQTGAARNEIAPEYSELLRNAASAIQTAAPEASVYVYGSVATGQASQPHSDVDLLTIGLAAPDADRIGSELSGRYRQLCRGVEIAAAAIGDFEGDGDEAYGNRVFLRHYCLHLAGPDRDTSSADFPGDRRAARGFNGDIAHHAARWHRDVGVVAAPELARRIARKTLLAVAALVSVHDSAWTTDREIAARRWSQIDPERVDDLERLHEWVHGADDADTDQVAAILESAVDPLVRRFEQDIGLWRPN